MDFIVSSIISGILYDLIKEGITLTFKNVFGHISANYDVGTLQQFLNEINEIKDPSKKIEHVNMLLNEENKYTVFFEKQLYKTNFSKRLDYIMFLMNEYRDRWHKTINLEMLGDFLGFSSVNDLKIYYLSENEPQYSFIDNVAQKLGVSSEWLRFGHGEPFKSILPTTDRALDIILSDTFAEGEKLFFVVEASNNYRRNIGIIRKRNNIKYEYYPHTYVFHADVGASGASELFRFYLFLKKLKDKNTMPSGCYYMKSEQFYKLFSGEMYPGLIEQSNNEYNYLLEDFINLYQTKEKKEEYEKAYDKVFVDCQRIILDRINKETY